MGDFAQKARLSFLDRAAHSYAVSAPSTSAHLMTQYRTVAVVHGREGSLLLPKGTCGACGSIMIPGQTCRIRVDDGPVSRASSSHDRKKRRKPSERRPFNRQREKTLGSECLRCWRTTRQPLQRSNPSHQANARPSILPVKSLAGSLSTPSSAPGELHVPRTSNNDSLQTAPRNANSKKRARARKESGLGAMLAKAKSSQTASRGFGLDLLDMMKKV
ncbi:MAG: hypothetical protein LQ347_006259 [Umbilicaria vellea]|nr:MAG: hypothetical protein LQ347_006259 [Umbilicaria vellea]